MRGAEALIEARRSGYAPQLGVVVLVDSQARPNDGEELVIDIEPTDRIDRLDLRCLIGLRVVAVGSNDGRVAEVVEAAKTAGAAAAIGVEFKHVNGPRHERWIASHKPWTEPRNAWPT